MNSSTAISFDKVSKCYLIRKQQGYIVRDIANKLVLKRSRTEEFWALREVSFTVEAGDSVAFIGGNGAGKSTLLRLIAGTLFPTTGHIRVRGRIGALLELGSGFHPDLSGRENIFLNASLLGMQRKEIEAYYEGIVAFSELGDFIDAPLRTYSSGMQVRLGFSVAIHIKPEIMIVDEALAVGDRNFQAKCKERISHLRESDITFLFVSHNPDMVKSTCRKAIWLDHGRIRAAGPVDDVLSQYQECVN